MRFSIKLFTWLGIPVFLHWSFALIVAYAGYLAYDNGMGFKGAAFILAAFLSLFACVLLHEYGHALAARRFGIQTHDIILTPIGGIARLEEMPKKPVGELVVAIAGPLVNVAIVAVLLLVSGVLFGMDGLMALVGEVTSAFAEMFTGTAAEDTGNTGAEGDYSVSGIVYVIFSLLVTGNCFLVAFNMIPAFPMDGGRVFRALLEMKSDKLRATRIAAFVGQVIALGFIYYGFHHEPHTTALIGIFIFFSARNEYRHLRQQHFLSENTVEKAIVSDITAFEWDTLLQTAVQQTGSGQEHRYVVSLYPDGRPQGITDSFLMANHPQRENPEATLASITFPFYATVSNTANLAETLAWFRINPGAIIAVEHAQTRRFAGFLTQQSVQAAVKAG